MNKAEQSEAILKLRATFKPGDTVCIVLRHVSRSGMSRTISVLDHENNDISWLVARALGMRFDRDRGGVKIGGCGMDMGFALVYDLSSTLFKDGFGCVGKQKHGEYPSSSQWCPSNDHFNGDRDYTPNRSTASTANGKDLEEHEANGNRSHWHKDGGYALSHRWI